MGLRSQFGGGGGDPVRTPNSSDADSGPYPGFQRHCIEWPTAVYADLPSGNFEGFACMQTYNYNYIATKTKPIILAPRKKCHTHPLRPPSAKTNVPVPTKNSSAPKAL